MSVVTVDPIHWLNGLMVVCCPKLEHAPTHLRAEHGPDLKHAAQVGTDGHLLVELRRLRQAACGVAKVAGRTVGLMASRPAVVVVMKAWHAIRAHPERDACMQAIYSPVQSYQKLPG